MLKSYINNNLLRALRGGLLKNTGGRNNLGRITAFHRGGTNKRLYRYVDIWRRVNSCGGVLEIIYDPVRTALLAVVFYFNGYVSSIVSTKTLAIGSRVFSGDDISASNGLYFNNGERLKDIYMRKVFAFGNAMPLRNIPLGTLVNCVEMYKSFGAQIVRSAGLFALLYKKTDQFAYLKLRSGWRFLLPVGLMASIGVISNVEHQTIVIGKAGHSRALGKRSVVRGVAMNPVDHPHGGGQGKTSGGPKPLSPWGKLTKWRKTVSKRLRSKKQFIRFKSAV